MKNEQRKLASRDQINFFFNSYYSSWRLAKILTNEKVIKERYSFYKEIVKIAKSNELDNEESLIAQEIKNGLTFDSLSNCIQYIEDLFALLMAGKNTDYFIRGIVTYNAGKVEAFIKKKFSEKELLELFYFPHIDDFEGEIKLEKAYRRCVNNLIKKIEFIQDFYTEFYFFYIQYKHGLTVALRPFKVYDETQIRKDKNGKMKPYLAAYDNLSIKKVYGKKGRFNNLVMIPNLTPNTQAFLKELQEEDNLLRYANAPLGASQENIKKCAFFIRECIFVFINNLDAVLKETNPVELQLPDNNQKVCQFRFPYSYEDLKAKTQKK